MPVGFFPTDPNVGRAIGNYNQGLSQEVIARMQSDAAIQQAQLQARAQQAQLQQQGQQQAQMNALREREMMQQGAYQQQQLENQRLQTTAQMEWQKALMGANAAEAAKDRLSKETIAGTMYGSRNTPSPADIQDANNRTQAMAGRLNFALKSLKESQALDEKKVSDEYAANMGKPFTPFTTNAGFAAKRDKALGEVQNRYRTQMQQLLQSVPEDSALDFDQTRMIFVPKMIGAPASTPSAPTSFFNNQPSAPAPTPAEVLPVPVVTPSPAPTARGATGALDRTITVRTSDGKVRTGPESAWPKLKAEDPGAEIISAPPPQAVPPATSGFFQTAPGSPAPNWVMQRMFGQ